MTEHCIQLSRWGSAFKRINEVTLMNMMQIFKPGDEIGDYCNGYFGRDDYENKTCVLVAPKYVVFEYWETGNAVVLNYSEGLESVVKSGNWVPVK